MVFKPNRIVACLITLTVLIVVCFLAARLGLDALFDSPTYNSPEAQSARATETVLTQLHGNEARSAIQSFIDMYWSLDAWRKPELLSEVLTGQELKYFQELHSGWVSKTFPIVASNTIKEVDVIEYSPTQFKVFSCEVLDFEDVTTDGISISAHTPQNFNRIYVFNRENGSWKVAIFADFTDLDELQAAWGYHSYPKWEKDLIGDLPYFVDIYDPCYKANQSVP